MKNRPARVRELIQRELGMMIAREMTFGASLVTVQGVDLTADFKHCHVHVGVLGTERERRDVLRQLAERRPLLQSDLSKRVVLKYTPHLHFHLDSSVERGTKVMEIMRQIDEVTPPESAEAAARRTDAFAEGNTDLPITFDADEPAEEAEEEIPKADQGTEKLKMPRSIRDAKGRGQNESYVSQHDDNDDE